MNRIAGKLGINPYAGSLTLRDLFEMLDGKREEEWQHSSYLAAAALNATPGRKKVVNPNRINPYRHRKAAPTIVTSNVDDIASVFPWEA